MVHHQQPQDGVRHHIAATSNEESKGQRNLRVTETEVSRYDGRNPGKPERAEG